MRYTTRTFTTLPIMQHILLSFELLTYALLQQPDPQKRIQLVDATEDCYLQRSAYHPLFAHTGAQKHPLLSIQLHMEKTGPALLLETADYTYSINASNSSHYSLFIHPHHPLLQLIPLSAFDTPLYLPHTLSNAETHQFLQQAYPHLASTIITEWQHPLTFCVPALDWPKNGDSVSTEFAISYQLPSPGPTRNSKTPHTTYIYFDGTTPTQAVTASCHSIYRHFLLDILLAHLPPDWTPVRLHCLTPLAHNPRFQLIPLPLLGEQDHSTAPSHPTIQHQMASLAFSGALLPTIHPALQELTNPTRAPAEHPGYYLQELAHVPMYDLHSLLEYSDTMDPTPHPQEWLSRTLYLLNTKANLFHHQFFSC